MSNFKSTLWAYDYYLQPDGLFKNLTLPAQLDKDTLVNTIMQECGEMQPLFTDAEFMQSMIGVWSDKWARTFEKWAEALDLTYDPISNYDRHEEWTDDISTESSGTTENSRSSYDSSTLTPHDSSKSADSGASNSIRKGRAWGNIGVTTSQQMVQSQLDLVSWNIYEHIKDIFMQEFCIMIY